MGADPKTLAEHIERLARQSRLRSSFIEELRRLLEHRAHVLADETTPPTEVVEEPSRAEADRSRPPVRPSGSRSLLEKRIEQLGEACLLQFGHLLVLRDHLRRGAAALGAGPTPSGRGAGDSPPPPGRPRKRLYVVPGPKDIQ